MVLADVDAEVKVGLNERLAQAVIVHDHWGGLSIVSVNEDLHQRVGVQQRIPQQFGGDPRLHFLKFGSVGLVLRLFVDADGLVLAEGLDVGTKHLEVGPGRDVLCIVHDVVPDEKVGRNFRPSFHVVHERLVLRTSGGEGMGKATFDAAQADDHIVAGHNALGRLAGVLIGKGADELVGELVPDGVCHLVDKPYHQARLSAVLLGDGRTLRALAEGEVVILRQAVDAEERVFAHDIGQAGLAYFQHLGVGKAELSVGDALAVAQTEVFGVLLKEFSGGKQLSHGVRVPVGLYVAVVVLRGIPFHVLLVVRAPNRLTFHGKVAVVSERQGGLFAPVQTGQGIFLHGRHNGTLGREPFHSQFILQEGEHTVHGAALRPAVDEQVLAHGAVGKALVVGLGFLRSGDVCHGAAKAHKDAPSLGGGVVRDGKLCAADLLDVHLQLFGRFLFRWRGLAVKHDSVVALSVLEQPVAGRGRHGAEQDQGKRDCL